MALEQDIMVELKKAMLSKDEKSLRGLRAIKAAIINAKTAEGAGGVLKEEDEAKMLQKLVKTRKDSLAIYQQNNREELARKEQEEIEVIEMFLPKQLTPEELKEKVQRAIHQLSKREFEIIRMKFFENKSYEEISQLTTTAPRTIYNHVYNALKILRKSLNAVLMLALLGT